jgi:hypothetical protein
VTAIYAFAQSLMIETVVYCTVNQEHTNKVLANKNAGTSPAFSFEAECGQRKPAK